MMSLENPRRRITRLKAQRAIDALMLLVQTRDWQDLDQDAKDAINAACREITVIRDLGVRRG